MYNLKIFLCSISCSQLNDNQQQEIQSIVCDTFCKCYRVSQSSVQLSLSNGETPNWDVAIAYDMLPSVPDAMSSKLNNFRDKTADALLHIIPSTLGYGGRVTVVNISKITFPSGTKTTGNPLSSEKWEDQDENSYGEMANQFQAEIPRFTFDQLVLSTDVEERLIEAISVLENRDKLFNQWNLKAIMSPSVLLNLYGDTGTGKSMTAEALASRLGKKIIRTTYADIESKYHGEGPKRLKALFLAAEKQDAVLFIDEADSMLSARLTSVTDGSAQAINSMRSQLLISLENYDGVVIFATNLIENYDKAFLTRLICLELKRPNSEARRKIWYNHLFPKGNDEKTLHIPLADDIDLDILSEYDFCGRDIRNTVKYACIGTVVKGKENVDQEELLKACERTLDELNSVNAATKKTRQELNAKPMTEKEKTRLIDEYVAGRKKNDGKA